METIFLPAADLDRFIPAKKPSQNLMPGPPYGPRSSHMVILNRHTLVFDFYSVNFTRCETISHFLKILKVLFGNIFLFQPWKRLISRFLKIIMVFIFRIIMSHHRRLNFVCVGVVKLLYILLYLLLSLPPSGQKFSIFLYRKFFMIFR